MPHIPEPPGEIQVSPMNDQEIRVRWKAAYPPTGSIDHFVLRYAKMATPSTYQR